MEMDREGELRCRVHLLIWVSGCPLSARYPGPLRGQVQKSSSRAWGTSSAAAVSGKPKASGPALRHLAIEPCPIRVGDATCRSAPFLVGSVLVHMWWWAVRAADDLHVTSSGRRSTPSLPAQRSIGSAHDWPGAAPRIFMASSSPPSATPANDAHSLAELEKCRCFQLASHRFGLAVTL